MAQRCEPAAYFLGPTTGAVDWVLKKFPIEIEALLGVDLAWG